MISYPLFNLPSIVVVPVEISSGDVSAASCQHVRSQKLRKEAICPFIATHLSSIKPSFAIQPWAESSPSGKRSVPIDRLLLPVLEERSASAYQAMVDAFVQKDAPLITVKYLRNASGSPSTEALHCTIRKSRVLSSDMESRREYWEMLSTVVQQLLRSIKMADVTCSKNHGFLLRANTVHQAHLSNTRNPLWELQPAIVAGRSVTTKNPVKQIKGKIPTTTPAIMESLELPTVKDAGKIDILLRLKPKLDPAQHVLHFELDLVPGVEKIRSLSEVILSTFGHATMGSGMHQHLPAIRGILIGLTVSRNYILPQQKVSDPGKPAHLPERAKDLRRQASSGSLFASAKGNRPKMKTSPVLVKSTLDIQQPDKAPVAPSRGVFIVQDVQLTGDVPSFLHKNGKRFTVGEYFKEVHKQEIAYQNLPLAKIGRDVWVPLEMLNIYGTQAIPTSRLRAGLLADVLAAQALPMPELSDFKEFADLVVKEFRSVSARCEFVSENSNGPAKALLPLENKIAPLTNRKSLSNSKCPPLKLGVLYLASKTRDLEEGSEFATDIQRRFQHKQIVNGNRSEPCAIINIDRDLHSPPLSAAITDIKPLVLPDCGENDAVQAFVDSTPTSFLAIIDTDGRSKLELESLRANVHKFGERKIGAVVYCTTRRTVKKLLDENPSLPDYFPSGPLWKLSEMHGGPNFEVENMHGKIPEHIIVLCAHVSHFNSRAARYCPSVAAVVASTDTQLLQFPGSIRLQNTYHTGTRDDDHKYDASSEIVDLGDMLRDRLQAWKTIDGDVAPNVVFYSSGIDIVKEDLANRDAMEIVRNEAKVISDVFEAEFDATPTLSYILVSKCTQPGSPYGRTSKETSTILNSKGIHNFSTPVSGVATSKHKYYVWSTVKDVPTVGMLVNLVSFHSIVHRGITNNMIDQVS